MVAKFTVLAKNIFADRVSSIECDTIREAFVEWGKLAADSNGAIILGDQDEVWAEFRPAQLEQITNEQRLFYSHFPYREAEAA